MEKLQLIVKGFFSVVLPVIDVGTDINFAGKIINDPK